MKQFTAKVISGDGIGRGMGYPTANLDFSDIDILDGVYASRATVQGKTFFAALVVSSGSRKKVEVHLLDYAGGDLYGQEVSVEVGERVSGIVVCETEDELKRKIVNDIELVRGALGKS